VVVVLKGIRFAPVMFDSAAEEDGIIFPFGDDNCVPFRIGEGCFGFSIFDEVDSIRRGLRRGGDPS
jgi:hypothetical protein